MATLSSTVSDDFDCSGSTETEALRLLGLIIEGSDSSTSSVIHGLSAVDFG